MSFVEVLKNLDWSVLTDLLISAVPAMLCISVHEMCHGLAAYKLGDNTAETQGRLSLNPLRHIDLIGLLMLIIFKFGWAKPVMVDSRNFAHPKRDMAITALAGPASNIVLAAIVLFIRGLVTPFLMNSSFGMQIIVLLDSTAYLSVGLGIFNLIPFPPLDGSKILFSFLPDRIYSKLMYYERYGMILLFLLLMSGILTRPVRNIADAVFSFLFQTAQFAFQLSVWLA